MKKMLFLLMAVLTTPLALADYGHMMGCEVAGTGIYPIYGVVWFTIVAFVFSVIFWSMYKFLIKEKPNKNCKK